MKIAKEAGVALKCQLTNQSQFDGHWNVSRHSVEEEIFIWGHHYRFPLVAENCIFGLNVHLEIGAVHRLLSWMPKSNQSRQRASLVRCFFHKVRHSKRTWRRGGRSWLSVPAANSHQFMKQEPGVVSIHPWQTNTIWSLNSAQPLTLSVLQSIRHLLLLLCLGLLAIRQVKWEPCLVHFPIIHFPCLLSTIPALWTHKAKRLLKMISETYTTSSISSRAARLTKIKLRSRYCLVSSNLKVFN